MRASDPGPSEPPPASAAAGLPPSTAPTLDEVRAAFPDLEIVELLGRGGMGTVFRARQKKLQRTVAIKVLPRALGEDAAFAERFLREARALAKLSHPGIVTVHDFGQSGGFFFLVMEYVDGLDLRHLMRQGLLEPKQALTIACELCQALQYAHDEGVVHRDIKPENVLLDTRGRVKIADFGLAKLVHPGADGFLSRADQVMGTPHYMAPEQLERPRDVDHRADIFSLGVVLYEMLTGSLPRGNFEPPSRRVHVDVRLDEIVLKALEREPERRYQQALEVKTDVDLVSSGTVAEPEKKGRSAGPRALLPSVEMDIDIGLSGQGAERAKIARELPPLPPARKDWFAGLRALVPFVALWILLGALWNAGAFPFGMAIPVAILLLGALLQGKVRADPELSRAIDTLPRPEQALRAAVSTAALILGLVAIAAGHFLHWERGTEHWQPSVTGPLGAFQKWHADPWGLLRLVGVRPNPGVDPVVTMERSFTLSSADFAAIPPFLLIGLGVVLLAIALGVAVHVPSPEKLRKRSSNLGLGLASYALGALLLLWVGAPIAALRSEIALQGFERRIETPLPAEEATEILRREFLEQGLQIDVDQRVSVTDRTSGAPVLTATLQRAQAASPFERWSTSFRGPIRATPQIWATILPRPNGSTIQLNVGLYDATSAEVTSADLTLARLQQALSGL
ncbi:MAG: protein kinase domain-containing protein [Planctomycetota bacterium]